MMAVVDKLNIDTLSDGHKTPGHGGRGTGAH
jgi:hypothetical protein